MPACNAVALSLVGELFRTCSTFRGTNNLARLPYMGHLLLKRLPRASSEELVVLHVALHRPAAAPGTQQRWHYSYGAGRHTAL